MWDWASFGAGLVVGGVAILLITRALGYTIEVLLGKL